MSMSQGSIAKLLTQPTSGERARQRVNWVMRILVGVAAFLAILPLIALIVFVLLKAIPFLVPTFFLNNPLDTEPGILNAIVGSLQLSGLTVLISAPIGIAGGVYLSEFAPPRVVAIGETAIDVMLGVPSIVAGVFAYLILVPVLGFSGWAAVVALSILTLPIMMRSTQEVLRLVPQAIREASLALGVPVWKTALFVSVRTALPGILTGVILAFSRALGETAPLLMTARGTNAENWLDFSTTMNAMPIVIYQYSNAASDLLIGQAWATALVLMVIALTINVLVRGRTVNSRTA
jgi:phosphate transport system permease protein